MFIHCELLTVILVLTLGGRVHAGRIIGGREAVEHSRPYMVVLILHMQDGQTEYCGGFLLNEDFVMTAAHCQAKSTQVLLGVHNLLESNGIHRISVAQTFPHKDYNATAYKNDIMLLKLSSKANFTKNVRPIALADKSDASLPKSCLVSGWGTRSEGRTSLSNVLMEVNITLLDDDMCAEENVYCSEAKKGPSEGDSGGPLVCEGKAYGVVSFTFKPASGGPEIHCFTKIPDLRNWIHKTMKKALKH